MSNKEIAYKGVMVADGYERIDGQNAFHSQVKKMTIGKPTRKENENEKIAIQIWREDEKGELYMETELPIHQVLDMMIFFMQTLRHFREAYRLPALYDAEHPEVARIDVQGGSVPVAVDISNEKIDEDLQEFSQALIDLGDLTGERLRVLMKIMEELSC
ncbi:DUF6530 family protein [Lachnospiraceae bacterium PAL227]|uniref:DUF6530 family protein n=2 Tax=Ohessyouella blattaphilus TaxID=2949333 RepID=A0ABT1EKF2_9FIRM|nr:DUF6530 family protein [Ohessyouella blattaphilus]MCP1111175.1 DUF6530 family protein [Ohessyouella blattaphilus]MCR8564569.1 DUF6530 family protein [Ohessyouella blattaphilus]MDL2251067.1 DUF6530 family protein [Lachnospiraceae bacterium OttesenSCG-928-J05]